MLLLSLSYSWFGVFFLGTLFNDINGEDTVHLDITASQCGQSITEGGRYGVMTFPSDTPTYPSNCGLTLRLNGAQFSGYLVYLTIEKFQIGTGDNLKVSYVDGTSAGVARTFFKGSSVALVPATFPITFEFTSDAVNTGSGTGAGLEIHWEARASTGQSSSQYYQGDLVEHYRLEGSQYDHVKSLNFPGYYANSAHHNWIVQAPEGDRIRFEFFTFATDSRDLLKFFEGNSLEDLRLIASYSGLTKPDTLDSTKSVVLIDFKTDAVLRKLGFDIKISLYSNAIGGGNSGGAGGAGGTGDNTQEEAITPIIVTAVCLAVFFGMALSSGLVYYLWYKPRKIREQRALLNNAQGNRYGMDGRPGTARPGTARPGTARPGTARPGSARPGTARPGTSRPGTGRPGTGRPGTAAARPGTAAARAGGPTRPGTAAARPSTSAAGPRSARFVDDPAARPKTRAALGRIDEPDWDFAPAPLSTRPQSAARTARTVPLASLVGSDMIPESDMLQETVAVIHDSRTAAVPQSKADVSHGPDLTSQRMPDRLPPIQRPVGGPAPLPSLGVQATASPRTADTGPRPPPYSPPLKVTTTADVLTLGLPEEEDGPMSMPTPRSYARLPMMGAEAAPLPLKQAPTRTPPTNASRNNAAYESSDDEW